MTQITIFYRKQDDITLEKKLKKDIKVLREEYRSKRSDYDIKLSEYNALIKKINNNSDTQFLKIIDDIKEELIKLD